MERYKNTSEGNEKQDLYQEKKYQEYSNMILNINDKEKAKKVIESILEMYNLEFGEESLQDMHGPFGDDRLEKLNKLNQIREKNGLTVLSIEEFYPESE